MLTETEEKRHNVFTRDTQELITPRGYQNLGPPNLQSTVDNAVSPHACNLKMKGIYDYWCYISEARLTRSPK